MEFIYSFLDTLLPFSWAEYTFMKTALLSVLLLAPVLGLIGTMVVNNRMAFFSDALGHSALTGVAIGVLLGFENPILITLAFAVLFALAISEVKRTLSTSADTVISVFSSSAMALGLILLSIGSNFSKYSSYLVGDLLSITKSDLSLMFFVFLAVIIVFFAIYKDLLLLSVNQSLAKSRGINVRVIENIFISLLAVLVTLSINKVGLLIINSMLILPAATARNIAKNSFSYMIISVCLSVFCGVLGLILSYYSNTAASAAIIFIMSVSFFISLLIRRVKHGS